MRKIWVQIPRILNPKNARGRVGGNTVELRLPHPVGFLESPFIHRLLGDPRY